MVYGDSKLSLINSPNVEVTILSLIQRLLKRSFNLLVSLKAAFNLREIVIYYDIHTHLVRMSSEILLPDVTTRGAILRDTRDDQRRPALSTVHRTFLRSYPLKQIKTKLIYNKEMKDRITGENHWIESTIFYAQRYYRSFMAKLTVIC